MRIAAILPLLVCYFAASVPPARAEGCSPFGWLCCSRHTPQAIETTNVSNTSKTPPVFTKMTGGTKRFVSGTKNLFVAKKPPAKKRGVTATHRAARAEPPKQGFFQRWFNPEPPPPPRTVEEWMSLEQIHP
ncbi:MAG: hypothetical protein WD063_14020 [Pirellulales bacterium]